MTFVVMEITGNDVFDYFFSIHVYFTLIMSVPTAIFSLFRN